VADAFNMVMDPNYIGATDADQGGLGSTWGKLKGGVVGKILHDLYTLPERAGQVAYDYGQTGQYNPAPIMEAAMTATTGGMPFAQAGALGSAGGKGIRGYHRSPNDFDKFDLSYTGTTTDPGKLGTAHYFSTDMNVAKDGPHRYEADIALKNPIELQYPAWGTDKQALITERLGLPLDAHAQDIRLAAMKRGHDGAVLDYSPVGYKHKEIAAYSDDLIEILKKYGLLGATPLGALMAQGNETQQ
jgi:hypothetical protein